MIGELLLPMLAHFMLWGACEVSIIGFIFQMRNTSVRVLKKLAQSHRAGNWRRRNSNQSSILFLPYFFLKILFIYFQREGKGGRKWGIETSMCGCLLHVPYPGPGQQPRNVPCLGIELVAFQFAGRCSIHWATPARATASFSFKLLGGKTISFSSHISSTLVASCTYIVGGGRWFELMFIVIILAIFFYLIVQEPLLPLAGSENIFFSGFQTALLQPESLPSENLPF